MTDATLRIRTWTEQVADGWLSWILVTDGDTVVFEGASNPFPTQSEARAHGSTEARLLIEWLPTTAVYDLKRAAKA